MTFNIQKGRQDSEDSQGRHPRDPGSLTKRQDNHPQGIHVDPGDGVGQGRKHGQGCGCAGQGCEAFVRGRIFRAVEGVTVDCIGICDKEIVLLNQKHPLS